MSEATRAEECEEYLDSLQGTMSEGQRALEALTYYHASGLPPPDWALREIRACYDDFKLHRRPSGWTAEEVKEPAPRTLGQAFGIEPNKGMHERTARRKALLVPRLLALFSGPEALPRSEKGHAEAADRLGLTVDQVRDWLDESGEFS